MREATEEQSNYSSAESSYKQTVKEKVHVPTSSVGLKSFTRIVFIKLNVCRRELR